MSRLVASAAAGAAAVFVLLLLAAELGSTPPPVRRPVEATSALNPNRRLRNAAAPGDFGDERPPASVALEANRGSRIAPPTPVGAPSRHDLWARSTRAGSTMLSGPGFHAPPPPPVQRPLDATFLSPDRLRNAAPGDFGDEPPPASVALDTPNRGSRIAPPTPVGAPSRHDLWARSTRAGPPSSADKPAGSTMPSGPGIHTPPCHGGGTTSGGHLPSGQEPPSPPA